MFLLTGLSAVSAININNEEEAGKLIPITVDDSPYEKHEDIWIYSNDDLEKPVNIHTNKKPLHEILQPGDIILYINTQYLPLFGWHCGHCRLFKEYNSTTNKYTIISTSKQVQMKNICEEEVYSFAKECFCEKIFIVRINATTEQKQNAIAFAERQIGKKFDLFYLNINKNFNPEDRNDRHANKFYCTELTWAAYYSCNNFFNKTKPNEGYIYGEGIDIDYNGWTKDIVYRFGHKFSFVHPLDIVKDDDVLEIFDIYTSERLIDKFF